MLYAVREALKYARKFAYDADLFDENQRIIEGEPFPPKSNP
jgi:hypothetical protein